MPEDKTEILNRLHVLLVDDEVDVLDTIDDLPPMCDNRLADSFKRARTTVENKNSTWQFLIL